jgi:hypothetical protein
VSKGARNIHALAGTLRRLERQAATGPCAVHPDRRAVGFISSWDNKPRGCCEECAVYGESHGYSIHREAPEAPDAD